MNEHGLNVTICPTCQWRNRETTDMVCMSCGRDYLEDEPVPGLGWKRLMTAWRAQCKAAEARLAAVETLCDRADSPERDVGLRGVLHTSQVRAAARGEVDRPAAVPDLSAVPVQPTPHEFFGSGDSQWCDTCGEADTDPIHSGEGDRG